MKSWILLSVLISTHALAWGPTGHRVVGEVAQMHLSPKASNKVKKLLKGESLAQASNWPDEIKSDPKNFGYTFKWHYTDWPDSMEKHDETHSSGSLVSSIKEQLKILKDKKATDEKKAFALKFLTHLVGDLHMPLHVGNGLDRGGNYCKVFFHDQKTNLHSLWDEGMINFTKLSFTELARFIQEGKNSKDLKAWMQGDLGAWALESKALRPALYPEEVKPSKDKLQMPQYCAKDVSDDKLPKLGYEYSYKFMPVLEQKLLQAGLRLAFLLNENLR